MNDVQKSTGLLAAFKRDIEPRMDELADILAERHGKVRVRIDVKIDSGDDWEFESHTNGVKTWIAVF